MTGTDIYESIIELAKQSGIESSLDKGEVAPGAAAEELLALCTLTTAIAPGSYEAYSARLAIALYVSSKMTPQSQKHWGVTYATLLRWVYSGRRGLPMSKENEEWWVENRGVGGDDRLPVNTLRAKSRLGAVLKHYAPKGIVLPPDRAALGRWTKIRCPFHDDRRPSASVNALYFRCHACGMHGDAIQLVMEKEGIGFKEALTFIEELR